MRILDDKLILKILSDCINENIDYYLRPDWYDFIPLSSIRKREDNIYWSETIIKGIDAILHVSLGLPKGGKDIDYINEDETIDFDFIHINNCKVYIEYSDDEENIIKLDITNRKLKSKIIKYMRKQCIIYYNNVVLDRCDNFYQIRDGDSIIGLR
jgi:hypothetical protein